jgi:transposase
MKRIRQWIASLWSRRDQLHRDARAIVRALKKVRAALDSPAAVALTAVIPGDLDERIRVTLVRWLRLLDTIPDEEPVANALIHKVGSMTLADIHGLTESEADTIIQQQYNKGRLNLNI